MAFLSLEQREFAVGAAIKQAIWALVDRLESELLRVPGVCSGEVLCG
jgi:hypothetical protein